MADLVQTRVDVKAFEPPAEDWVQGGGVIPQGSPVYHDETDDRYKLADANDTLIKAAAKGIAITPCSAADGYFMIAKDGSVIDLGADLEIGKAYIVSNNAGGIAPFDDAAVGWFLTILGFAETLRRFRVKISSSPVAIA